MYMQSNYYLYINTYSCGLLKRGITAAFLGVFISREEIHTAKTYFSLLSMMKNIHLNTSLFPDRVYNLYKIKYNVCNISKIFTV